MFRISRNGHEPIVNADALEEIEQVIRAAEPGRYQIDEVSADRLLGRSVKLIVQSLSQTYRSLEL
jgi:hypothetical protein